MRATKAADRSMQKLAVMLAAHGIDDQVIAEVKETAPSDKNAISRQGEAVLLCLESPAKFTTKKCKRPECGEYFGTNYRGVGYCSDNCRAKEMERQLGIKWNWWRPEEERWGGEPPLVIPPAALQKIQQLAKWCADNLPTETETESPTPTLNGHSQNLQEFVLEEIDRAQEQVLDRDTSANSLPQSLQQSNHPSTPEVENPFDFE